MTFELDLGKRGKSRAVTLESFAAVRAPVVNDACSSIRPASQPPRRDQVLPNHKLLFIRLADTITEDIHSPAYRR